MLPGKIRHYQSLVQNYTHTRTTLSRPEDAVTCSLRLPLLQVFTSESSLDVDGVSGGNILSPCIGDELEGSYKPPLLTLGRRGVTNDGGASVTDSSLR